MHAFKPNLVETRIGRFGTNPGAFLTRSAFVWINLQLAGCLPPICDGN
jgi:hypothetical protein